jgi:hypothetical protein
MKNTRIKLPHLRWHPDPTCSLGVSGQAKLVEEYNELDRRYTNQRMQTLVGELFDLASRHNYFISEEILIELYRKHFGIEQ